MMLMRYLEQLYLACYWIGRDEPVPRLAVRFSRFLSVVSASHPLLGGWRKQDKSKKAALTAALDFNEPAVFERLLSGVNERDRRITQMSLGLWNGRDGLEGASLSAFVSAVGHDFRTVNTLILKFPF